MVYCGDELYTCTPPLIHEENEEMLWSANEGCTSADISLVKFNWTGDPEVQYKLDIGGPSLTITAYVDLKDLKELLKLKL